ncbi:hypothetical protein B4U45_22630 [Mycobacterium persicum]|uniref:STAS domain-containing protein n=1 Tax=Mycobacterium persicum TaxID=1487726 RepID=A0A8E2IXI0_9MYCO|nr:STAS domain-containing protein [Mycobacterium avium]KZS85353.1 hypothetical protein A4G31_27130 [Mycobacterium persicum]ORC13171.1 hypothetical protein B1T46_22875 [Mycobacterium kansasii]MCA2334214.1 hypothetical protein [Mycobacterium avium]ORB96803.1 hypothetical protein B1T44_22490 [Mycobacterium persicum]ORC03513.1 hypothetical protein B1T48_22050 [Mycobacterium persicum]
MTLRSKVGSRRIHRHTLIDCAGAQLDVPARSLAIVVRVDGEVDAANTEIVDREVLRFARLGSPLIVDYCRVQFLEIAGFRALLKLADFRRKSRLQFSVIAGSAMQPPLRVITDHGLPLAASVPEALQQINDTTATHRESLTGMVGQRQRGDAASSAQPVGLCCEERSEGWRAAIQASSAAAVRCLARRFSDGSDTEIELHAGMSRSVSTTSASQSIG